MENTWAQWLIRGSAVIAGLVRLGEDAKPFATALANSLRAGGDEPSEAEWATLKEGEEKLRARLHAPLPDA